jgi:predicted nucleic acid-binding Zn finger protein|tara:strand:+ start:8032 stop:8298 length:267 start_codon:yes stop_codon:yes gene_type:complete
MMSLPQYYKAKTMIKKKWIKVVSKSSSVISFKYREYDILYLIHRDWWSCTCEFGSLWSKTSKDCCHIMAGKLMIEWENLEAKKDGVKI